MDHSDFERIVNLAASDTKKGAEIVARAFYRVLRKNGFTENQIINIATNILSYLTEGLKGYEKKVEQTHQDEDGAKMSSKFQSRG